MNKKSLLFILFLMVFGQLTAQHPEFFREDLTFIMEDSSFTVTGNYYFYKKGKQDAKLDLMYPFPESKDYGKITTVYAFIDGNPFKNALLTYNPKAAMIRLKVAAGKITIVRIGYTQAISGNKAEYILTTTNVWGQSLQEVNYTLIVPESYTIDSLSYEPDFKNSKNGKNIYYYHKENFMPDREFEVYFGR